MIASAGFTKDVDAYDGRFNTSISGCVSDDDKRIIWGRFMVTSSSWRPSNDVRRRLGSCRSRGTDFDRFTTTRSVPPSNRDCILPIDELLREFFRADDILVSRTSSSDDDLTGIASPPLVIGVVGSTDEGSKSLEDNSRLICEDLLIVTSSSNPTKDRRRCRSRGADLDRLTFSGPSAAAACIVMNGLLRRLTDFETLPLLFSVAKSSSVALVVVDGDDRRLSSSVTAKQGDRSSSRLC